MVPSAANTVAEPSSAKAYVSAANCARVASASGAGTGTAAGDASPGTVGATLPRDASSVSAAAEVCAFEGTETALLFTAAPKRFASGFTLRPTSLPVLALTIVAESPSKRYTSGSRSRGAESA